MVFITGRSALLGERLQDSTGKEKVTQANKKGPEQSLEMQEWAKRKSWVQMAPPGSRLSGLAQVCLSSQRWMSLAKMPRASSTFPQKGPNSQPPWSA